MLSISNRSVEPLHHLSRYIGARSQGLPAPGSSAAPRVTVALSREAASRGSEVARRAAALLDWPVYDRELLQMIAEKYGISDWVVSSLDEHYVGWLELIARGIGAYDRSQAGTYLRGLRELLA